AVGVRPSDVPAPQRGRTAVSSTQGVPPNLLKVRKARRHVPRLYQLRAGRRRAALVLTGPSSSTILASPGGASAAMPGAAAAHSAAWRLSADRSRRSSEGTTLVLVPATGSTAENACAPQTGHASDPGRLSRPNRTRPHGVQCHARPSPDLMSVRTRFRLALDYERRLRAVFGNNALRLEIRCRCVRAFA